MAGLGRPYSGTSSPLIKEEEEAEEKRSLVEPYNFGIQLIHDAH